MKKRLLSLIILCITMSTFLAFPVIAETPTSGTYGENLTWSFDNGVLTISGSGSIDVMVDGILYHPPWSSFSKEIPSDEISRVVIEYGITGIGQMAFAHSNLTSLEIAGSVTTIGNSAFHSCENLTSVTIPEGVTSIEYGAFGQCKNLERISLPKSITHIDKQAFDSKYITVFYAGSEEEWKKHNFDEIFYVVHFNHTFDEKTGGKGENYQWIVKDGVLTISGSGDMEDWSEYGMQPWSSFKEGISKIVIEEGITSIGAYAFESLNIHRGAEYIIVSPESVEIAGSVTKIGDYAFYGCEKLTSITIPEGVTSIGVCAFSSCENLERISLPKSIEYIDETAFNRIERIRSVFYAGSEADWEKLEYDKYMFGHYADIHFNHTFDEKTGGKGENYQWIVKDGVLTISGNGDMENWDYSNPAPWCSYSYETKKVAIENGVTSIGNYAFTDFNYLTNISIPQSVTAIGSYAFRDCEALTSITIPKSVATIENNAFLGCNSLAEISVDSNNNNYCSVEGVLFTKDKSTLIKYPAPKTAYKYSIPDGVTTINSYAFCGCTNVAIIEIPVGVTTIGADAFRDCNRLKLVMCGDGLTTIETCAFYGCYNLESIILPASLTVIEDWAFVDCSLNDTYYAGCEEDWKKINIDDDNYSLLESTFHYNWSGNADFIFEKNKILLTIGNTTAKVFGEEKVSDVAPEIVNGRTMLPARFVAENLGAEVIWQAAEPDKILIKKDDIEILFYIGSDIAYVNGKEIKLDCAVYTKNNRTYTPVRFIVENLGSEVEWNNDTQTVVIIK